MMRRRHKKSRRGCLECKKRHIKCDETRPRCINCTTVERDCQYSTPGYQSSSETSGSPVPVSQPAFVLPSTGSAPASVSAPAPASDHATPAFSPATPMPEAQPYLYTGDMSGKIDIVHMQLFYHYLTNHSVIYPFVDYDGGLKRIIIEVALREPFLLHSIIAMASRHLSMTGSSNTAYYHDLAIELQTHALSLFNSFDVEYFAQSIERRVPVFLFSAILGFHALCDMLACRDDTFPSNLARLTGYFRLHRGILAVMEGHWEDLKKTELSILFDKIVPRWYEISDDGGSDCDDIKQRIQTSPNLDDGQREAYAKVLAYLQWVFDAKPNYRSRAHLLCSFAVMIPRPFVDDVEAGRPEALAILAYFYVALHFCRDIWLIGNSGQFLLASLASHLSQLGPEWPAWLEKPCQMLRDFSDHSLPHGSTTTSTVNVVSTAAMGHDIVITRPSEADAGRIAEIHIAAMDPNPLLHAQFPTPKSLEELHRFLEAETLDEIRDPVSGVLVSRDGPAGPVTGFVKWTSPSHPQDVKLEKSDIVHLEGCCRQFLDEYGSRAEEAKERSVGDKPCYRLSFVCTDPQHQGRGIGTLLTRRVLEMAERDHLPVYLESTDVAVSIYERLGFRSIDSFEMRIPRRGSDTETVLYKEECMVWYPSGQR
ncbi:hypothetical protein QBC40DRAFT_186336 [Triangularia verruculosa]|uniref:Zn(2)-C6 fungal-type domain-containing protein n=1 Tax=Triangularia verruculosa TaxID=2587418 RepID=A0AAN6X7E7_9PEZI|nr:hypothetical protein QBC40DRAFT_186336 [Triangularia verruculosa]